MFRWISPISLVIVLVSCQTIEDLPQLDDTTQTWLEDTMEQSTVEMITTSSSEEVTAEEYLTSTANDSITDPWEEFTTEQDNLTTQMITSTLASVNDTSCSLDTIRELLEESKKEIIDTILLTISRDITTKLANIEERLSTLTCSDDKNPPAPIKLDWQIYQNLQIPLTGWLRVFDQPYSHTTRADDLSQLAGICHNEVLVAASYNGSITLAAVGPVSVLKLNTMWNQVQQFGDVYWYRSSGKSFGFSPLSNIRQTSADNEDLNSPLRLSWLLDQNTGGYRAGSTRALTDNTLWHKMIYCN